MSRRLFIVSISIYVCLILAGNFFSSALAEQLKEGEERTEQIKGPIVITADTLTADNRAHTALFVGSVVAKTENMTLYSEKMLVFYSEDTGNVVKIDAEGQVKLVKKDLVITSDLAIYYAGEEKVVFTGNPKAVEKGNIVTGSRMIYLLKEDRSFVEKSKITLENKKVK